MPMIKCTDEQAYLIELCLETMCRASLGQLTHFVESIEKIRGKSFEVKCPDGEVRSFYSLGSYIEEMIKPILFPELSSNESYGVGQKAIEDLEAKEKELSKNLEKQKGLYEVFSEDKINIDIYKDRAELLRNEEKRLRRMLRRFS